MWVPIVINLVLSVVNFGFWLSSNELRYMHLFAGAFILGLTVAMITDRIR